MWYKLQDICKICEEKNTQVSDLPTSWSAAHFDLWNDKNTTNLEHCVSEVHKMMFKDVKIGKDINY